MIHGPDQHRPGTKERPDRPDRAEAQDKVIASSALFGATRTVAIRHGAQLYTLRITRADKLLLTK